MTTPTPEAIIGLDLDGRGFDEANRGLDRQLQGWERIERSALNIGSALDSMTSRIMGMAGGVGVGALIADFVRLEDVASRAALSVNRATGRDGYAPFASALRGAAVATSTDSRELGAALTGLQSRVGGNYLNNPDRWKTLGIGVGNFSRAYGVDLGTIGSSLGTLALFQKTGPQSAQDLLATIAAQAARTGMAGQTAQFMQAVTMATGYLGGMHPGQMQLGASRNLGALYGAVASVNPAFKDPALFTQGVASIDQTVSQSYRNPRLQAVMQMAGIGYREQRGGLAGPNGQRMAEKLLAYSQRAYGQGTIEQDLFLRSNFGDVSADMLQALVDGTSTYQDLMRRPTAGERAQTRRRARSDRETPSAMAKRGQEDLSDMVDDALREIQGFLGIDSGEDLLALGAGTYAAGKLGKAGLRRARRGVQRRGANRALDPDGARVPSTARSGWKKLGGRLLRGLPGLGLLLGAEDAFDALEGTIDAEGRTASPAARARERQQLAGVDAVLGGGRVGMGMDLIPDLDPFMDALKGGGGSARRRGKPAGGDESLDKFRKAVDRFHGSVSKLLDDGKGRRAFASDDGGGMNAAGAQGLNDRVGASMVLARMVAGGGGGGGGGNPVVSAQTIAMGGTPTGGGGGGGGSTASQGGGWKSCELTWYQPSKGGINADSDPTDYADGSKVNEGSDMVCAAPAGFAFGTRIEFSYKGRSVVCTVRDRGGAITGSRFDLMVKPARELGIISAGRVQAKYRVVGGGSSRSQSQQQGSSVAGRRGTAAAARGGGAGGSEPGALRAAEQWMSAPAGGGGASGGGTGRGSVADVHVHIDGRKIEQQRQLVRGRV